MTNCSCQQPGTSCAERASRSDWFARIAAHAAKGPTTWSACTLGTTVQRQKPTSVCRPQPTVIRPMSSVHNLLQWSTGASASGPPWCHPPLSECLPWCHSPTNIPGTADPSHLASFTANRCVARAVLYLLLGRCKPGPRGVLHAAVWSVRLLFEVPVESSSSLNAMALEKLYCFIDQLWERTISGADC
jgi:hypothetical protein